MGGGILWWIATKNQNLILDIASLIKEKHKLEKDKEDAILENEKLIKKMGKSNPPEFSKEISAFDIIKVEKVSNKDFGADMCGKLYTTFVKLGLSIEIAVLVAAGSFGYMLALLQRRVGSMISIELVSPRFFILLEGASKILLLAFGQGKDAFFAVRGESLLSSVENDTFFVEDKTFASYEMPCIFSACSVMSLL
ncbi:hypothetical protein Tco_1184186 [Tanacetum coccineum]